MARFDPEKLDQDERAFVELVEGLHQRIETLKMLVPPGRMRTALETMQEMNAVLVAAALKSGG